MIWRPQQDGAPSKLEVIRVLTPRAFASALVLAMGACDTTPTEDAVQPVVEWDSAGITIVDNNLPEWDETGPWTVGAEPEFVIGGTGAAESLEDPAPLVWSIWGLARLSDGRVLVHSGGSEMVMLFEPSGELSTVIGRKGEGPGEYIRPQHIQLLPGDTIAVWDYQFTRVNYFDPAGTLVGHRTLDIGTVIAKTRTDRESPPESIRIPLPDGSMIVQRGLLDYSLPKLGEIRRHPREYLRIDTAYAVHSFGWWQYDESLGRSSNSYSSWLPFAARSLVAAGGNPLWVYITNGDRYEIHQHSPDGILRRIFRRDADRIPITAEQYQQALTTMFDLNPHHDWSTYEQERAAAPPREYHPPINDLRVDTQGYLWVSEPRSGQWSVFDTEGKWLGMVETPDGHVGWIDEDMILLVRVDPTTHVQRIEGYRLKRHH